MILVPKEKLRTMSMLNEAVSANWERHVIISLQGAPESDYCQGNQIVPLYGRALVGINCGRLKSHGSVEIDINGKLTALDPMSRVPTIVSLVLNGTACTGTVDCQTKVVFKTEEAGFHITHRTYATRNGELTILLDLMGCRNASVPCVATASHVRVSQLE
jgi:hypothetical protein